MNRAKFTIPHLAGPQDAPPVNACPRWIAGPSGMTEEITLSKITAPAHGFTSLMSEQSI